MAKMINYDDVIDRYYAEWELQDICSDAEDKDWLMKCINEAPEIEAEQVVYCENCISWQIDTHYCGLMDDHTNSKNFCCWGEESPFRKK